METIIQKYRGKINLRDEICRFKLENSMCEFSIRVKAEKHDEMFNRFLKPLHTVLKGNKDYQNNQIVVFDTIIPKSTDKQMGIIFWCPTMKHIPYDLISDPGRYQITLKTIDNVE